MARCVSSAVFLALSVMLMAAPAAAQSTKFTLDLFYNGGLANGGTWKIVGIASPMGFAQVEVTIEDSTSATIVAPPELEIQSVYTANSRHNISIRDDLQAPFPFGIGVLGGSHTPYVDPPSMKIPGQVGFDGGIVLVEGTFGPGQNPRWGGTDLSGPLGVTFFDSNGVLAGGRAPFMTRSMVVPEPAAACLASLGLFGLMAALRRSRSTQS